MYGVFFSYAPKVKPTPTTFFRYWKRNLPFIALPFLMAFLLTSCKESTYASIGEEEEISREEYIKNGEYLVTVMGCHDCHSPKRIGERGPEFLSDKLLSGFQASTVLPEIPEGVISNGWFLMNPDLTATVGPWGVSFAANLTSHETGIGTWSLEQFKRALVEGKFKGMENARTLLPPMPWQNFKHLKEEDLKAIYYYLQSTPPVENGVPAPIPPGAEKVASAG